MVADALSRVEPLPAAVKATFPQVYLENSEDSPDEAPGFLCNAIQQGIDYGELANAQVKDPDVQAYRTAITKLRLVDVPFADGAFTILCDISTGSARPVVLEMWRRRVFDTIHALAHPGARLTKRLVSAKFVWHGLNKHVTQWAKSCLSCQRSKVQKHVRAPFQTFQPTHRCFDHIHIHIDGPLSESNSCKYLLTVIVLIFFHRTG